MILALILAGNSISPAQSAGTTLSGIVVDQNEAVIPGVKITILNVFGTLERSVLTDLDGFFTFPLLPSGDYSLRVEKEGFDTAEIPDLALVDNTPRTLRIVLKINPIAESIKVIDEPAGVAENAVKPSVSEQPPIRDLPLNGVAFQSAVRLVPGVVLTPVNTRNLGQFSANGQRTNANYLTVDGVSANFGTTNYDFLGQTGVGSIPAQSAQGGLDNLISSEAVAEMTIRTNELEPFFGRTPGAQIALVSRAGSREFSGSAFGRLRNEIFNARDYFDLEKPAFRFHNLGGYLSGPVDLPWLGQNRKGEKTPKTFFFFSFEHRNFLEPQPTLMTNVPSLESRIETSNEVTQAIFNSFPLPSEKKDDSGSASALFERSLESQSDVANPLVYNNDAPFSATYSEPNRAENYSLRLDHVFSNSVSLFARYNYSPSFSENRNPSNLSSFAVNRQTTETLTFGSTQVFSHRAVNELRVNLSRQEGDTFHDFDGRYGGKLPDLSLFVPSSFDPDKTNYRLTLSGFPDSLGFSYGNFANNRMRQFNLVDNFSWLLGSHELKFGVDYRRLSPTLSASEYGISYEFNFNESLMAGTADRVFYYHNPRVDSEVTTFSAYLQDNWKPGRKINLLFGVRWDLNPSPAVEEENSPLTLAVAPDLERADQNDLRLASPGTSYYATRFDNFAPRLGLAWQLVDRSDRALILRAGAGIFYDLGQAQFNERRSPFDYASELATNLTLPIRTDLLNLLSGGTTQKRLAVISAAPDYVLPRTYFWNVTAQQNIGHDQTLSVAYVGAAGRKLQRTLDIDLAESGKTGKVFFSQGFARLTYIDNAFSSDYHALQVQFARKAIDGLQVFANYTWSHSIDDYSSDSNIPTPGFIFPVSYNRGNSDFDARHVFNAGFRYEMPAPEGKGLWRGFLQDWAVSGVFFARAGLPFDVKLFEYNQFGYAGENRRPDLLGGLPIYLEDASSPTGFRLNADAFIKPGDEGKQGNLGRNSLAGLPAWQLDLGLEKSFNLTAKSQISLRWEIFNIFNHPNFSNPFAKIVYDGEAKYVPDHFGLPIQTMARGYKAAGMTGGVNPVFQVGGARSMQFALKFSF